MSSSYVGFFAFPESHLSEIERLYGASRESLDEMMDDFLVRENDLYRYAAEIALDRIELSYEPLRSACSVVDTMILDLVQTDNDWEVFRPEQCQALTRAVSEQERDAGGEKNIVGRMLEGDHTLAPEGVTEVYRAYKRILAAAVEHNAGFVCAVLRENAEAELAADRAEEAEKQRRAEEHSARWDAMSPAEREAEQRRVQERMAAWQREMGEQYGEPEPEIEAESWLYIVRNWRVRGIRRRRRRGMALIHQYRDAGVKLDIVAVLTIAEGRSHTHHVAVERSVLTGEDRASVLACVHDTLAEACDAVAPYMVYSARQARKLARAIERLEKPGGERAIIDRILERGPDADLTLAASVYRQFKRVLRDAVERKRGFAYVIGILP